MSNAHHQLNKKKLSTTETYVVIILPCTEIYDLKEEKDYIFAPVRVEMLIESKIYTVLH